MKILKMLAVFLVLLALTVGAVAEVEYTPFGIGEIEFEFPIGVKATVNQTVAGHIDVVIDSEATDWSTVVAQMDHWGAIPVYVGTELAFGATAGRGNLFNTMPGELTDWSYSAMKPLLDECFELIAGAIADGDNALGGVNTLMDYSVSTNTLVPRTYSKESGQWLFLLEGYCDENRNILGQKYCTISITYTDPSIRKVTLNKVPKDRIVVSENAVVCEKADVYVDNGSVSYELENYHSAPEGTVGPDAYMELTTLVLPPEGAKSYVSDHEIGGIRQGTASAQEVFTNTVPPTDYFEASEASFFWYDGEFDTENNVPTGNLIRAERISITMAVGDPVAWPNYVSKSETEAVSDDKISFGVYNSQDGNAANFAVIDYDPNTGMGLVKRDESVKVPSGELTEYVLRQKVTAPENTAYYSYTDYSYIESSFMGPRPAERGSFEDHKKELDKANKIAVPENGVVVFEDTLFNKAEYKGEDEGLVTYYDYNVTEDDSGDIVFIQWYDKDGNVVGVPQWFAMQYNTMAITTQTEIKSALPTDAENPTLFTTVDAGGYILKVTSYPQTSEDENQIHYELELYNQNGEYAELNDLPDGTYNLFIPFPEDLTVTDNLAFTVNHYNADSTLILEDANEEGTAKIDLTREATGVWMKVTSLSPFVMSWRCKHTELTYAYSRNSITEACMGCDHKATWTIEVEESCVAGTEIGYQITCEGDLIAQLSVAYYNEKANEITSEMPTEPGKYSVIVGIVGGDWILDIPFTVVAAPAMPATGDRSLPLAALLVIAALATTTAFALRRKATRA